MPYDVIVVGLGGMGSSAAYHLAARGQKVLGLERHTPAHDKGSSHGGSRIIRQSYFEDPAYVPLLLRAYDLWEKLERDSGQEILTLTGGLFVGSESSRTVAASLCASRQHDLPHELLDSAAVRKRFPTFDPADDEVALFEAKAGFVRPEAAVSAHLALADRAGATLQFGESVLRWEATGFGVEVVTTTATYRAARLVICPGAWAPELLDDLGVPIQVERQVMYWFEPQGGVEPYLADRHPIYIHEDASGEQIYGFPAIDGPGQGAKMAFFRGGQSCTPETIDRQVHDAEVARMAARADRLLPGLATRFLKAATCMYSNTPDQHFVIAQHPGHDEVTVACGFSGHGFKFVPVVGEVLADLATTGSTDHPISLFDPRRFTPRRPPRGDRMTSAPVAEPSTGQGRRPTDPTTGGHVLDSDVATDSSLIPTLAGSYYTDPEVFRAEQKKIFESLWFCAVRSYDLAKPGQWQAVDVGGESVIVIRGKDRTLRAFLNICRHRGARLCTEPVGETARNLQCPYHAWTYGLDGKLVAAPNLTKMPDVDRVEYGLVPVHLREWLGYAWLCLADEPPSFEEDVQGAVAERLGDPGAIERYEIPDLEVGRRIRYDVKANWKLIIENFMECYHCATIHPELTEVLPEFADGFAAQYFVGHGAEFGDEVSGFTVDGSEGFDRLPGVAEDQDRRYYAVTVKPNVFINLVPDHVIVHRMFPTAEDRTVVECDWLYSKEVVASGRDVTRSVELFHRVNQQDFEACERTQPAMSSRAYEKGGVLVPSEHHIGAFHDWLVEKVER